MQFTLRELIFGCIAAGSLMGLWMEIRYSREIEREKCASEIRKIEDRYARWTDNVKHEYMEACLKKGFSFSDMPLIYSLPTVYTGATGDVIIGRP